MVYETLSFSKMCILKDEICNLQSNNHFRIGAKYHYVTHNKFAAVKKFIFLDVN